MNTRTRPRLGASGQRRLGLLEESNVSIAVSRSSSIVRQVKAPSARSATSSTCGPGSRRASSELVSEDLVVVASFGHPVASSSTRRPTVVASARTDGVRRSRSRARARVGPMAPTGIPVRRLISAYGTGGSSESITAALVGAGSAGRTRPAGGVPLGAQQVGVRVVSVTGRDDQPSSCGSVGRSRVIAVAERSASRFAVVMSHIGIARGSRSCRGARPAAATRSARRPALARRQPVTQQTRTSKRGVPVDDLAPGTLVPLRRGGHEQRDVRLVVLHALPLPLCSPAITGAGQRGC